MSFTLPPGRSFRFNPPPNWPAPPPGWTPPQGWMPDPSWPAPPYGWPLWTEDPGAPGATAGADAVHTNTVRPVRPGTIRAASAVMLLGAALAALSAISVIFDLGLAYQYAGSTLFSTQTDSWSFTSASLPGCLYYLIECGVWLWVARAVNAGGNWTRAAGIVLLAALAVQVVAFRLFPATLGRFALHFMFVGGYGANAIALDTLGGLLTILIGIAGCAVVVMLWLPPSGQYFHARQKHSD
jgi:hypothetical protein